MSGEHYIKANLASWKESGIVGAVQVLAAPECCLACAAQAGRIVPLDDAIRQPPVPCHACTSPPCRCDLLPVMADDFQ